MFKPIFIVMTATLSLHLYPAEVPLAALGLGELIVHTAPDALALGEFIATTAVHTAVELNNNHQLQHTAEQGALAISHFVQEVPVEHAIEATAGAVSDVIQDVHHELHHTSSHELPTVQSIQENPTQLVSLAKYCPDVKLHLRYSTKRNITNQQIYPQKTDGYVHPAVAPALQAVDAAARQRGYGIMVWDAYQSPQAQQQIWDLINNEQLVTDPSKIKDARCRGMSVDVTLYHLKTGRPVIMPTDFGNITVKARPDCVTASRTACQNRDFLTALMMANGFEAPTDFWWHFNMRGWETVEPCIATFDELAS